MRGLIRTWVVVVAFSALLGMKAQAVEKKAIDVAVERGVAALKRMQQADGSWPNVELGATALAGLTLLECGIEKNDKAVVAAANKVREGALTSTHVYSLSLAILFLDKLDRPTDTPLIESMLVRLIAGQNSIGQWSYETPPIADAEMRRLVAEVNGKLPKGTRDLKTLPVRGKRTVKDLAPEIRAQLEAVGRAPGNRAGGDNSNTQFAILALWVGRRYGVPTQPALIKADKYFRATQHNDGSWSYAVDRGRGRPGTPAMTCAGILGLAFGHGSQLDLKKVKDPKAEARDVSGDAKLKSALQVLSTAIGTPVGWKGSGKPPPGIAPLSGKAYYYLWSLERVGVALKLETIGKKNWYDWGAEILLANQDLDGNWTGGEHTINGADQCFALLFLKRANLTRDLASGLTGIKDPGKMLRVGGVGGETLKSGGDFEPSGIGKKPEGEEKNSSTAKAPVKPTPTKTNSTERPSSRNAEERAAARLGDELPKASSERRGAILREMRDTRGVAYTEALVAVIGRLDGEARKEARIALAERLTRMKPTTLREYLKDDEPEIRRAASLATSAKGNKEHIPDLISLLGDPEPVVQRAAYHALKKLSGKDFGPDEEATLTQRKAALDAWRKWWKTQSGE